jgi:hypothetical protein
MRTPVIIAVPFHWILKMVLGTTLLRISITAAWFPPMANEAAFGLLIQVMFCADATLSQALQEDMSTRTGLDCHAMQTTPKTGVTAMSTGKYRLC